MKLATTAITIGLVILGMASPVQARKHHSLPIVCPPARVHVIAADAWAQAYVFREQYGNLQARACAYHHHRSYELENMIEGEESEGFCEKGCLPAPGTMALAGAMIAFADNTVPSTKYGDCYCATWRIVVRDLRNGHVLHNIATGPSSLPPNAKRYTVPEPGDYVGTGPALKVLVKSDGAVAWIVNNNLHTPRVPSTYEIRAVDSLGSRIVASSPDIDPSSLALAGSTLYWTESGKPFSATLD